MNNNLQLVGMIENIHLLRKLFIRRVSGNSPLNHSQVAMLRIISQFENCTQSLVAEKLGVTAAAVATSAKRLQQEGLISRTVDEDNQRCKRLALTDMGRNAIREHLAAFQEYDELIFRDLSEDDKVLLESLLGKVVCRMQELEGINENFQNSLEMTCALRKLIENGKGD